MGKKFILIAFLLIQALSLSVNYDSMARPARTGKIAFMQPDGSSFVGSITGDEFFRLKMTETGESIIQDEDGWWCYAAYDALGNKYSSGVKVGASDIAAKTASRQIPYAQLIQKAAARRAEFDNELALKREKMRNSMTLTKAGAGPVEKHGIIILAAYSDVAFTYSKQNFENMMNQSGYSYNGATGSAKDYFEAQFGNMYNFTFDVSDIVTLPNNRKYYGQNVGSDDSDARPQQMVSEACTLAADSGVDFSKYDDDGDGYVDTVFVIFAGDDEADSGNEDCIWAHAWALSKAITLSGKKIFSYACASELGREIVFDKWGNATAGEAYLAGIGTFCHEYSHTFGLADLYDTDYTSNGNSEALWSSTGLMDGGNMNNKGNTPPNWNAIDRVQLGVGNCTTLESGQYNLKPISENGDYCKLETGNSGEYYLIECRDNNNVFDRYIGGSGLLVYHIDRTSTAISKYWNYNTPNAYSTHQCADLIEADQTLLSKYKSGSNFYFSPTVYESHYNDLYRLFFPYNDVDYIDESYALTSWYGVKIDARIENICRESDGSISFTVSESDEGSGESGGNEGGNEGEEETGNTQSKFLAIKLNYASRSEDGSFAAGTKIPLKIINGQNITETKWFFNTKPVTLDKNSKWTITQSGELKAEVYFSDGNKTIIYKEITVK